MQPGRLPLLHSPRSRRDFLRSTGLLSAGGSIALLSACGDDEEERPDGDAPAERGERDVELLNAALDLENTAVAAYTGAAALLRGEAAELGELLAEQEQEHADGIAQAIRDLGGTPNEPRTQEDYADELGLADLRGQDGALRFALDLENRAIAAYIESLPKLSPGPLRGTVAAILTNEAQHQSVLRDLLGREPVPEAFVTGRDGAR